MDFSLLDELELRNFISTYGKSIVYVNLVKLWRMVTKYRELCEIQSFKVCEVCIFVCCARQSDNRSFVQFRGLLYKTLNYPFRGSIVVVNFEIRVRFANFRT
jgi:hypothetical protein